jgi:hypothetical protein
MHSTRPHHTRTSAVSLCIAVHIGGARALGALPTSPRLGRALAYASSLHSAPITESQATTSDDGHRDDAADAGAASELARLLRFHFPSDRARALTARVALAATLQTITGRQPSEMRVTRSYYGKPALTHPESLAQRIAFNMSHHGEYALIAVEAVGGGHHAGATDADEEAHRLSGLSLQRDALAECASSGGVPAAASSSCRPPLLGCDVTTHALPSSCASTAEYFACMRECFTDAEWRIIRHPDAHARDETMHTRGEGSAGPSTEGAATPGASTSSRAESTSASPSYCSPCALIRFAWLWSLKESLIKAIGMGLSFALLDIEFRFATDRQAVFDPVEVTFRGHPNFAAEESQTSTMKDGSADSSTSASSVDGRRPSSVAPLLARPPELAQVRDLVADIEWQFESTLLADGAHIASRCRGYARGESPRVSRAPQEGVEESPAAAAAASTPPTSAVDVTQLHMHSVTDASQLARLGVDISYAHAPHVHSTTPEGDESARRHRAHARLHVREVRFEQIAPLDIGDA